MCLKHPHRPACRTPYQAHCHRRCQWCLKHRADGTLRPNRLRRTQRWWKSSAGQLCEVRRGQRDKALRELSMLDAEPLYRVPTFTDLGAL